MADFVKGLFGAQKPVAAPADDGGASALRPCAPLNTTRPGPAWLTHARLC